MTYQQRITEHPAEPTPVKLRVEDYVRLNDVGAFERYGKVELIDGTVVALNAQFTRHALVKSNMAFELRLALRGIGSPFTVIAEGSLKLPPHDMPEPDFAVIDPRGMDLDTYLISTNTKLVGEVSYTSTARDLGAKQRLYAAHEIPEYWVVDLNKDRLYQFWGADPDGYTQHRTVPLAGELRSITLPDLAVDGTGLI